ncbi:cell division protein FtsI (penicillin-binding protein 3) [Agromyces flavus]|uniref:Cell division protein FtsI (Penicillin-binding protein 3) n=2 Tax=Actinomycetes TaxID=1760 RepID=A0A1H1SB02_9MICO|nr:penicillin-binding protein 2 [Agromyces flavus]MCP2368985.1 cell division protein FtsI (penicillin-binding protein 3) [Agromyces flavus]GGI48441.1 cell division protein FtsI [Agromyces flavus]SDS45111.1 cell division protein FtsI (penicillin-binding protein 3) [Agromyces flavus]
MNRVSRRPLRRIIAAGLALVLMVGWFVIRLVDIQVVRAAELNAASEDVRSRVATIYGERGEIVDANGIVLADSVMRYDIALSPKQAMLGPVVREQPDPADPSKTIEVEVPLDQVLSELGAVIGRSAEELRGVIDAALEEDPDSDFAYVAKLVDTEAYEEVGALDIPWVVPYEHPSRRYPNGAVAGNLLGFMDPDGNAVAGLEYSEDACLAGENGQRTWLHSLKDWVEIPGSERVLSQARQGGDLQLTIDSDLQYFVQRVAAAQVQATGAQWATVTVMEAKTGRLLAVADVPTVDPNSPSSVDSDDRGSRAFTAPFEPGSTFKALTSASVIDAGKGDPTAGVTADYQYLPSNGADITDSHGHGPTNYTMTGMLIDSSNTAMSLFGERVSDEQRYEDMLDFGLGSVSEVGFAGEAAGDLHGGPEAWDAQTKYATMFGQGLTTTAIQIASVYQTIANGGVRMPVTLVDGCRAADGVVTERASTEGSRVVSEKAADQTAQMLERVYLEGWLADDWNIPGYRVAAKTGTAQVADGNGGYQSGHLVSVSGFAPADDPEFVVSVSIMDPVKMNSSAASAPVFQQVMSQVLKKYRTIPSGAPAPELPATW